MNLPQPQALHAQLLTRADTLLVVRQPVAPPRPAPGQPGTPPIIDFRKASCCLRSASKPGIEAIGFGKVDRFSTIFDWLSRSISKEVARNCGITACIPVV